MKSFYWKMSLVALAVAVVSAGVVGAIDRYVASNDLNGTIMVVVFFASALALVSFLAFIVTGLMALTSKKS